LKFNRYLIILLLITIFKEFYFFIFWIKFYCNFITLVKIPTCILIIKWGITITPWIAIKRYLIGTMIILCGVKLVIRWNFIFFTDTSCDVRCNFNHVKGYGLVTIEREFWVAESEVICRGVFIGHFDDILAH
jgi:hypothetical protein